MKYRRLYLRLSSDELYSAGTRYHYDDQMDLVKEIYRRLIRCIHPVLYYEYDSFDRKKLTGIISLGNGPDQLMELYQKTHQFTKAYAVQCLSMELLSCSYKQLKEIIYRERRQFLINMHFYDQERIKKLLPELKKNWSELPVSMNEAFALIPSQTVIFLAEIGNNICPRQHLCYMCQQKNCAFRHITGDKQ